MVRVHECMMLKSGEGHDAKKNISSGPQQKSNGEPEIESRINNDSEGNDNADTGTKLHPQATPSIEVQDQERD